jgi:hypothetical protein
MWLEWQFYSFVDFSISSGKFAIIMQTSGKFKTNPALNELLL